MGSVLGELIGEIVWAGLSDTRPDSVSVGILVKDTSGDMVAATESDTCGVIVCSSDTDGCKDSDDTVVLVGLSVAVIDCFGVLLLDSAEDGLRLNKGDRDPVVDRLVVLELVKDWLGLEEWLDVLEFVGDAVIEDDKVDVLDEVVLDV